VSISLVLAARASFPRPHDFDLTPLALEPQAWHRVFGSISPRLRLSLPAPPISC
jgi:hypothetical protein